MVFVGVPGTIPLQMPRDDWNFGESSYMWSFDCLEVSAPNPLLVQGSAVYSSFIYNICCSYVMAS